MRKREHTPNETKISYWRRLARWLHRSQRDSRSQLAASLWLGDMVELLTGVACEYKPDQRQGTVPHQTTNPPAGRAKQPSDQQVEMETGSALLHAADTKSDLSAQERQRNERIRNSVVRNLLCLWNPSRPSEWLMHQLRIRCAYTSKPNDPLRALWGHPSLADTSIEAWLHRGLTEDEFVELTTNRLNYTLRYVSYFGENANVS